MNRFRCLIVLMAFVIGAFAGRVSALTETGTYQITTQAEPDAQAGGWFINLGITGARGKMTPAEPTVMEVAYVFKGTPAYGKLKKGDE